MSEYGAEPHWTVIRRNTMRSSRIAGLGIVVGLGLASACGAGAGFHMDGARNASFVEPGITIGTRHADAVAEARRLVRLSPTMTGETRIATAPVKSLRHPPFAPAESQLVIRHRFWVSDRTLTATFDALKKLAPHGTRTQGEGESGDHGRVTERDIEFAVVHLPGTLADADLDIQVVRDGHGHSAVGAYAEVVPQPKRRPNEHVPLSVRTVKLLRLKDFPSRVVKSRTINGRRAATLVRDFDALVVRPPGEMSCPAGTHETEAVFRSQGHTWRASYPSCDAVSVTRGGHQLPDLVPDRAFTRALHRDLG